METAQKSESRSPRIGEIAPDFRARSTAGEIQLSKLRGRWVIFFSHPADFTPVCSTEFAELARRQAEFDALDTALLGLSVDSLYSHMAWVRAIRETLDADVRFPIIEDPSMAIGRAYGMIDEQSADSMAMRSTFFIDPEGVIRAITCYPHNVGRSVDEMLRMLKALKAVSNAQTLAPEGWREGKPLLSPASDIDEDREDWFCRFVDAP
ncbi:putative peroxiredoxin [Caenibius tardaugens NBRC 16725]|uniref:Alkyl hydroperoxide reductase C n=1 Tax=Caenibius tardaugens NBRC 16725 TaxID=1219035 RepID=U2YR32_9SPHN|nr:peroxiredoxin [Caenibius tardaugens]AZI35309.1 peroxiredoxin [Caenibius tardaugens NBRC 16725]GAD51177.1 putative peroxiredoxin [Caenibius tardaugens NBRC 16725]